jgi:geranylgeranyl diphosphate synthase type I
MTAIAPSLDGFEAYLDAALRKRLDDSRVARMIGDHFGLDDPSARRGKRLRPRILLAVAHAEGAAPEGAYGAAAAVEMLHNFSLIHDDIEDRDELRHGRPTLWSTFGVASAIEAGNALCSLTYLTLLDAAADRPALALAMERTLLRAHHLMCAGQSHDIEFETTDSVSFERYTAMIEGKTAALFSVSCELGALAAGASDERAAAYGRIGRAYGLAFQIRDDILGIWGLSDETGKPSGADLRRRKWSFPVTWALDGPSSADRDLLARMYAAKCEIGESAVQPLVAALERLGARQAADETSSRYVDEADAIVAEHNLDPGGAVTAIFRATLRRLS